MLRTFYTFSENFLSPRVCSCILKTKKPFHLRIYACESHTFSLSITSSVSVSSASPTMFHFTFSPYGLENSCYTALSNFLCLLLTNFT